MPAPDAAAEAALVAAARAAEAKAIAPYSTFTVGAALLLPGGAIVSGCNIENATYGLTMCAERVALFKALSDGHRRFEAIAISASAPRPTPPCGSCRQLLWEFCGDIPVITAGADGEIARTTLGTLFPSPFGPDNLQ